MPLRAGFFSLLLVLLASPYPPAAAQSQGTRHPLLQQLDFLVGDWRQTCRILPGPFGPVEQTCGGKSQYRWSTGRLWLSFDSVIEAPERESYEVHGVVSYDPATQRYTAFAFNSAVPRGMEYTGDWTDENTLVFTSVVRSGQQAAARIVYSRMRDGRVRFSSEASQPDGSFKAYFEAVLAREP